MNPSPRRRTAVMLAASVPLTIAIASGPRTVLRGTIVEPVARLPVGGAVARLDGRSVVATDGRFRIESRARSRSVYPVQFTAPGYRSYQSWTAPGERARRDVVLFPADRIEVPDYGRVLADWEFEGFFNELYRDDHRGQFPSGLVRWVEQPEFVLASHVLLPTRDDTGRPILRATDKRVPDTHRQVLAQMLRDYVGPLSGGVLSGDELRIRRYRPGEEHDANQPWPAGEVSIAVLDLPSDSAGGGAAALDGAITAAQVTLRLHHLRTQPGSRTQRVAVHEIAHALGMRHGPHGRPGESVSLCSIMGNWECDFAVLSPLDVIAARLAYARRPGNTASDLDPEPAAARAAAHVIAFDDGAAMVTGAGAGQVR